MFRTTYVHIHKCLQYPDILHEHAACTYVQMDVYVTVDIRS